MDKITLVQNALSAFAIIAGLVGTVAGFLFLMAMKAVNRVAGNGEHHVDVFVNGRRTDAANLKADDVDALIHTMNPDERAALKKRLEEDDNQTNGNKLCPADSGGRVDWSKHDTTL